MQKAGTKETGIRQNLKVQFIYIASQKERMET